ncbi:MAG TPA: hypothetical protein VFZ61_01310 [Polyangiales bacterium]
MGTTHDRLALGAVSARVDVVRSAGRYRLHLHISTPATTADRQLHAARCDELVEAAAWLIALTVDPTLRTSSVEATEASDVAPRMTGDADSAGGPSRAPASAPAADTASNAPAPRAPEVSAKRAPSDTRSVTPVRRASPRVALGVHLGARGGVFAGAGAGVQAALSTFVGLRAAWSFTQLHAAAFLPRAIELPAPASAESWSWTLGLAQCAHWGDRLRGGPCAMLTGLRTSTETRGVNGAAPRQQVLWATGGPGFTLLWRAWRGLELSAAGHMGIPISPRPRFSLEPLGPVISAEPWTVDLQLGISFAHP